MNGKTMRTVSLALAVVLGVAVGVADADFVFDQAQNAGPIINTSLIEIEPTPESLSLWFARRSGPGGAWEEWRVSRPTEDAPWENPVNFGAWEESSWNSVKITPSYTTADGLELYFYADQDRRPEGYGGDDLYMKKRERIEHDWGPAVNLGPSVNTRYDESLPAVSPDGLELYFSGWSRDARPGGFGRADLWVMKRNTRDDPWGEPVNLGATVNTSSFDARPKFASDGLLLLFESDRPGGFGDVDLYLMSRATVSDPWTEPVNLGPKVNSPASDEQGFLSPDGLTVYFHSDRTGGYGGYDIWQASLTPIVDFNGDGKVDGRDVLIMAAHWGQSDSLLDIGPYAWGDGVVDIEDVAALADYIGREVYDPTLVAHWPLDEVEGMRTRESVSGDDSFALGDPIWERDGGQVGGALQMDGVDDWVATGFVLDPSAGPFSILAWIRGGGPGQLIITHAGGTGCLMLDEEGRLMTELTISGRNINPLQSETVIDDGLWHRIGLTWDGFSVKLCVDDVVVAEDMVDSLGGSGKELCIGLGKTSQPGTSFSGLIDDVRIYNRAMGL